MSFRPYLCVHLLIATVAAASAALAGCSRAPENPGCLASGDPQCALPPVCERLSYTCNGAPARVSRITSVDQRLPGLDAEGTIGDIRIENDQLIAVIDDIDHPHHLSPAGGTLIDLAPRNGADHLSQIYHATGILPRDAIHYRTAETRTLANGAVAVVVKGTLDGDSLVTVTTQYELRPCDVGVRIRTEIRNGGRRLGSYFLSDAYWVGGGEMTPFVPVVGRGFNSPALDIFNFSTLLRQAPWMAMQTHSADDNAIAEIGCGRPTEGVITDTVLSAFGHAPGLVQPGDGMVFERMIMVANGAGLSGVQALAQDAHRRMFAQTPAAVTVTGHVVEADRPAAALGGDERVVSLLFYEPAAGADPDDPAQITPQSETVPDRMGAFSVQLVPGKRYRVQPYQLGRKLGTPIAFELSASAPSLDLGAVAVRAPARVTVQVVETTDVGRSDIFGEVVVVPTDATTVDAVRGTIYGQFDQACAPYLGFNHGPSPGCNRVLVRAAPTEFAITPGTYWVYALGGIRRSLSRKKITVEAGQSTFVLLETKPLGRMEPLGSLAVDMQSLSGHSYDTSAPDIDRVTSAVTGGLDVVVITDHDTLTSYDAAIAQLNVGNRLQSITGVKATPFIPWSFPPGSTFPRTLGRWGFFPLTVNPALARNGALWDELQEPGQLFEAFGPLIGEHGIRQAMHPTTGLQFARHFGYLRALDLNPTKPIPLTHDGSMLGELWKRPGGDGPSHPRNIDYDTQEVMNGTELVPVIVGHRLAWHAMLNAGIARAGTCDSDSHSLEFETLGYGHNIVLGDFALRTLDRNRMFDAVRAGNMLGTNGPIVDAAIVDGMGSARIIPSVNAVVPNASSALEITVRAAPWVPVEEVRVIVDGNVVRSITGAALSVPPDPLGTEGLERYRASIPLSEIVPRDGHDHWIVVEAGLPLPAMMDTDDDGYPDRVDGDGDGQIDDTGILPARETDSRFHVDVVSPRMWPLGFTNPFLIDHNNDGWKGPRQ